MLIFCAAYKSFIWVKRKETLKDNGWITTGLRDFLNIFLNTLTEILLILKRIHDELENTGTCSQLLSQNGSI